MDSILQDFVWGFFKRGEHRIIQCQGKRNSMCVASLFYGWIFVVVFFVFMFMFLVSTSHTSFCSLSVSSNEVHPKTANEKSKISYYHVFDGHIAWSSEFSAVLFYASLGYPRLEWFGSPFWPIVKWQYRWILCDFIFVASRLYRIHYIWAVY